MSRIKAKNIRFARRRNRSKQLNRLQSDRFRLVVTRSLKNISAQIVDDSQGITLT